MNKYLWHYNKSESRERSEQADIRYKNKTTKQTGQADDRSNKIVNIRLSIHIVIYLVQTGWCQQSDIRKRGTNEWTWGYSKQADARNQIKQTTDERLNRSNNRWQNKKKNNKLMTEQNKKNKRRKNN